MKEIYTIDIGGSSIKHSIITFKDINDFEVLPLNKIKLKSNVFLELKKDVFNSIKEVIKVKPISCIAICTTGSVSNGIVLNAGHFKGYSNVDWKEIITNTFPNIKEVIVLNDGKASAWAEFKGLSDKSVQNFIHLVLGTGIGGATVVNGKILEGEKGFSGYLGHIRVTNDKNVVCSCGNYGCLETVASVNAIVKVFNENHNKSLNLSEIILLAKSGDDKASPITENASQHLGKVIGTLLNIINPGVVTLGGGMIDVIKNNSFDDFLLKINKSIEVNSHRRVFNGVSIKFAKYGNDGGMIGAALLAYEKLCK